MSSQDRSGFKAAHNAHKAMRGLAVFILDIRSCKSQEAEVKRINKELANIRCKFKGERSIDGYQKKKYICKLLFIFLLGHDIDFGHMEAINLLSSNKYTEKQIGYLFISVLVSANSNLMKLIVQSVKHDLSSSHPVHVCLALQCIANIGSREMAKAFKKEIPKLLLSEDSIHLVKQAAALCLLRLFRVAPDVVALSEWSSRLIHLLNDQHLGVVTAAVSLIDRLALENPEEYKACVHITVSRLSRIVTSSGTDLQDYTYYSVPAPWVSVKLLRLLQHFPPPEEPSVRYRLIECLEAILKRTTEPSTRKVKTVHESNAKNAVLLEAINLIIHMDSEPNLLIKACYQLGYFLRHRETNLRSLALESMCLLATSEFSHDTVKMHQDTVVTALKTERDVTVRRRAMDLLYAMCDRSNVEEIVSEMLFYLETADYFIREELVLKVAILTEKYAIDYTWYVDTILHLIRIAGDYVSEEVWHRVIHIVTNRDDVQGYAAKTVFEALQAPACHENMIKVGGYILGEFGNLIAGDPRSAPMVQFKLLHSKFHRCSVATRGLLLSTYIKFVNLFPEIKGLVQHVLNSNNQLCNADIELQQRAIEYLQLSTIASLDFLATVLEEMPPFPERESFILTKLKQKRPEKIKEIFDPPQSREPRPTAQMKRTNSRTSGSCLMPPLQHLRRPKEGPVVMELLPLSEPEVPAVDSTFVDVLSVNISGTTKDESSTDSTFHGNNFSDREQRSNVKFICANNGLVFKNDFLQIGFKCEYRQNLGRVQLFYSNNTNVAFTNFTTSTMHPTEELIVQAKYVNPTLNAHAQTQQLFEVECLKSFTEAPTLTIGFHYKGQRQMFAMKLPLTLNKFMEGTEMDAGTFFTHWKQMKVPSLETQRILHSSLAPQHEELLTRLRGFGMQILPNIDPNPKNFACAGILSTTETEVGCLLRLEPDEQSQMIRLTTRTSFPGISNIMSGLFKDVLELPFY